MLVENVGGAGGTIGITRVARAAPDGYTISIGTWGTHVLNSFIYSPPYDLASDFETVALLPSVPHWFIARKNLPPENLQELVTYMKANKVTAGSVGAGGSSAVGTGATTPSAGPGAGAGAAGAGAAGAAAATPPVPTTGGSVSAAPRTRVTPTTALKLRRCLVPSDDTSCLPRTTGDRSPRRRPR